MENFINFFQELNSTQIKVLILGLILNMLIVFGIAYLQERKSIRNKK